MQQEFRLGLALLILWLAGIIAIVVRAYWKVSHEPLTVMWVKRHRGWVSSVVFSPDGQLLASASRDKTIKLWRVSDGRLVTTLMGHIDAVNSVAFSPDGQLLASGSDDATIKIWRIQDGRLVTTLVGHNYGVSSVVFSPEGQLLASGGYDGTAKIWQVKSGQLITTLKHRGWVLSVAFSPDGRLLALGADGTIYLWRVADSTLVNKLMGQGNIGAVAFSADGQILVSASDDHTIVLHVLKTQANLGLLSCFPLKQGCKNKPLPASDDTDLLSLNRVITSGRREKQESKDKALLFCSFQQSKT